MNSNNDNTIENIAIEKKIIDNIGNVILNSSNEIQVNNSNNNNNIPENNNSNSILSNSVIISDNDNVIIKSSSKDSIMSHYDADDEYESQLDDDDSDSDMDPYHHRKKNQKQLEKLEKQQLERKKFRDRLFYVLLVDFILLVIFIPLVYVLYYLPSLSMGDSEVVAYWYYHFQFSKFTLWLVSISIGFAYVAMVTEGRSYPFHCRYKRSRDFFQLLLAVAILYMIGPSRTLMGPNDSLKSLNSIGKCFLYNYFSYCIPYVLGLHYTYLDKIQLLQLAGDKFGTPSLWNTFKLKELVIIVPVVIFILALVVYHCYLLVIDHLWWYFLIAYFIYFFILFFITWLLRKTHYLHMHHYFIFGSLIPFSAFQTVLSSISLGLLAGIMTEGVSRWSMGFFWYRGARTL
ncbi:hypothetical protein DLAC_03590 [Tieghemostelium lacteum]|uniref:Transmembrane protein n=1 Tax=Tieghemostelium lacteum TaxID=361077 RepID=A0A152A0C7_TIELA|nr:hypothetical protein DLAC_03590 [Tieghemostelium lacteum]|eukprot:KYQ99653.1 hypothetical protein DLAC_03590 [Tieghemostelium lacteum]